MKRRSMLFAFAALLAAWRTSTSLANEDLFVSYGLGIPYERFMALWGSGNWCKVGCGEIAHSGLQEGTGYAREGMSSRVDRISIRAPTDRADKYRWRQKNALDVAVKFMPVDYVVTSDIVEPGYQRIDLNSAWLAETFHMSKWNDTEDEGQPGDFVLQIFYRGQDDAGEPFATGFELNVGRDVDSDRID